MRNWTDGLLEDDGGPGPERFAVAVRQSVTRELIWSAVRRRSRAGWVRLGPESIGQCPGSGSPGRSSHPPSGCGSPRRTHTLAGHRGTSGLAQLRQSRRSPARHRGSVTRDGLRSVISRASTLMPTQRSAGEPVPVRYRWPAVAVPRLAWRSWRLAAVSLRAPVQARGAVSGW